MCSRATPKRVVDSSLLLFNTYRRKTTELDECLADEILEMNRKGIQTQQCCCGHGESRGGVLIRRESWQAATAAGYRWEECVAGLEHLLFIELRPHPAYNPNLLVHGNKEPLPVETQVRIMILSEDDS